MTNWQRIRNAFSVSWSSVKGGPTLSTKVITFNARLHVALLTFSSFLLGSTGWLLWMYHLADLASPAMVDVHTMGAGYLMQAVGIGGFVLFGSRQDPARLRRMSTAAIAAYVACLPPATLLPGLAPALAFGYLANLLCGFFQAYYVYCLARFVEAKRRGLVFGGAYAATTMASWLLAVIGGGVLTHGRIGLLTCIALAVSAVLLAREPFAPVDDRQDDAFPDLALGKGAWILCCAVVAMLSLTKNVGFGFPTADLLESVSLESSRLLYGVGLLAAGLISDRDRRLGALCCAGALVTPFLMLSLSGAAAPATLLWALGYLLFGFFSVYRVVLLADLSAHDNRYVLAGAGLGFGRVGDSLGTLLTLSLAKVPLTLITTGAVLFALTMALFFVLNQQLYAATAPAAPTERERFERFAAHHDLSARERDVLRLLLAEHSNAEIASELFVSEATVKYHVRNLLRKTGCKSRLEVLAKYAER